MIEINMQHESASIQINTAHGHIVLKTGHWNGETVFFIYPQAEVNIKRGKALKKSEPYILIMKVPKG